MFSTTCLMMKNCSKGLLTTKDFEFLVAYAIPLLRPFGLHKLDFRSKPCIFLGYHYAGYKCLDPVTNKVYLSRHVVFDESSFPDKEQATSLLPSQLSLTGNSTHLLSPTLFTIPVVTSFSLDADTTSSPNPISQVLIKETSLTPPVPQEQPRPTPPFPFTLPHDTTSTSITSIFPSITTSLLEIIPQFDHLSPSYFESFLTFSPSS